MVHFQGGGWCISPTDCLNRAGTALGSSSKWGPNGCPNNNSPVCYADGGANGMFSANSNVNPHLYNWNKVFINYCDGGSYAGTLLEPITVGTSKVYFRGRFILDAVFQTLFTMGLQNANEVILKGCSAGGLATYLHADYVRDLVHNVNPNARFVAAPGAGFFLDIPSYSGKYVYRPNYQWVFSAMNVSGSVNQACIANHTSTLDTWRCYVAPYTLPYIETPLFVSNSLGDAWQLSNIMDLGCNPASGNCDAAQLKYFNNFRLTMINQLEPVLGSTKNGAFLQECDVHVVEDIDGSWNGILVQNQTQMETFQAWYTGASNASPRRVDGPWNTNPTCSKYGARWRQDRRRGDIVYY